MTHLGHGQLKQKRRAEDFVMERKKNMRLYLKNVTILHFTGANVHILNSLQLHKTK